MASTFTSSGINPDERKAKSVSCAAAISRMATLASGIKACEQVQRAVKYFEYVFPTPSLVIAMPKTFACLTNATFNSAGIAVLARATSVR